MIQCVAREKSIFVISRKDSSRKKSKILRWRKGAIFNLSPSNPLVVAGQTGFRVTVVKLSIFGHEMPILETTMAHNVKHGEKSTFLIQTFRGIVYEVA